MNTSKFVVRPAKSNPEAKTHGDWYFTLVAANGKVVATSEIYTRRQNALNGIKAVRNALADAIVVFDTSGDSDD